MGMRIERSADVNASWDGKETLTIGTPETLDEDDSLAQMILHEVCHALVEGPESLQKLDWGLENNPAKKVHEHAALRLQAALADTIGMRAFFASTTIFRSYYDGLPENPLADGEDTAIELANVAWSRFLESSWNYPLLDALRRTAEIAKALEGVAADSSLWHGSSQELCR